MSLKLNFFPAKLNEETLTIWRNPSLSGKELHDLKSEYDSIYFKRKSRKNLAIPLNQEGVAKLSEIGFKRTEVRTADNPKLFSILLKRGFIRNLLNDGLKEANTTKEMVPLNFNEFWAPTYDLHSIYYKDPKYTFKELQFHEGIKVRSYYFNLPGQGFVPGLTLNYTTTFYFDAGLDTLLSEITELQKTPELFVQRRVPPKCDQDCKLYGKHRLLGRFAGFVDEGEGCISSDRYIKLDKARIDFNIPASRVTFERNFENIKWWGESHGKSNLIEEIRAQDIRNKGDKDDVRDLYNKLQRIASGAVKGFELTNEQTAKLEKSLEFSQESRTF